MGVGLVAARASGTGMGSPVNAYYTAASGTSMACPMTSGVVALLLEKNFSLTPAQVKDALTTTAKRLGTGVPNNIYGYGRVQAKAAFDYVLSGSAPPVPTPTPDPLPVLTGPPSIEWSQAYSQNATDLGYSAVQTADGGCVATGYTYKNGNADLYLVKTDATGNKQWSKTYGGAGNEAGYCVNQTADGGYIVAGLTGYGYGYNSSVYLLKTDAAGTMQWNKSYNIIGFDMGVPYCRRVTGAMWSQASAPTTRPIPG